MLIANAVEIPDECPKDCLGKKEASYQGCLCTRCPIFLCKRVSPKWDGADENEMFCILEPEDYRKDWALVFQGWFKGDTQDYPELKL